MAAGLADRCEVQIAYAIGVAHPVSIMVECFGTERVSPALITELVQSHFDLRPAAIIRDLKLLRPIYEKTAAKLRALSSEKMPPELAGGGGRADLGSE